MYLNLLAWILTHFPLHSHCFTVIYLLFYFVLICFATTQVWLKLHVILSVKEKLLWNLIALSEHKPWVHVRMLYAVCAYSFF